MGRSHPFYRLGIAMPNLQIGGDPICRLASTVPQSAKGVSTLGPTWGGELSPLAQGRLKAHQRRRGVGNHSANGVLSALGGRRGVSVCRLRRVGTLRRLIEYQSAEWLLRCLNLQIGSPNLQIGSPNLQIGHGDAQSVEWVAPTHPFYRLGIAMPNL